LSLAEDPQITFETDEPVTVAVNFSQMEPVRSLPGLDGLFMAGQWTAPYTGTIIAAISGRQVIQFLCSKEKKIFNTGESACL
jgi:hypothetical protein